MNATTGKLFDQVQAAEATQAASQLKSTALATADNKATASPTTIGTAPASLNVIDKKLTEFTNEYKAAYANGPISAEQNAKFSERQKSLLAERNGIVQNSAFQLLLDSTNRAAASMLSNAKRAASGMQAIANAQKARDKVAKRAERERELERLKEAQEEEMAFANEDDIGGDSPEIARIEAEIKNEKNVQALGGNA